MTDLAHRHATNHFWLRRWKKNPKVIRFHQSLPNQRMVRCQSQRITLMPYHISCFVNSRSMILLGNLYRINFLIKALTRWSHGNVEASTLFDPVSGAHISKPVCFEIHWNMLSEPQSLERVYPEKTCCAKGLAIKNILWPRISFPLLMVIDPKCFKQKMCLLTRRFWLKIFTNKMFSGAPFKTFKINFKEITFLSLFFHKSVKHHFHRDI